LENLPFVSIIIPTYKHWGVLQICLDALKKQTYGLDLFEVIIINNDSDLAGAPSNVELAVNMRVIHEAAPGSYAARNKGVSEAKGDVVGFTDSDCIPEESWISNAVDYYLENENAARVAGKVKLFQLDGGSKLVWYFESITAFNQRHNVKNGLSVTANMFVTKKTLDAVGLFNETLYSGGDMEWNKRATLQGVGINYVDNVQVSHPARLTYTEMVRKTRRTTGGAYLRQTKADKRPLLLSTLLPPVTLIKILRTDNKSYFEIFYAMFFIMTLRFFAFFEIIKIMLGGKPIR
jgi:glycosyltransferase involved in cell wall biosynthesis